jgi:hypothetical protein
MASMNVDFSYIGQCVPCGYPASFERTEMFKFAIQENPTWVEPDLAFGPLRITDESLLE